MLIQNIIKSNFNEKALAQLYDASSWADNGVKSIRCSVFDRFLNSYDECVRYVDQASPEEIQRYRNKFINLLEHICSKTDVYQKDRHGKSYAVLSKIDIKTVINLTEKSKLDLYLPKIRTIFFAHDDFGFIVLYEDQIPEMISESIISNGLHML